MSRLTQPVIHLVNTRSQRKTPSNKRQRILDAARQIVVEEGTDKLTIERVVEVSGVSRGGFNYHFRSRQDLIRALAEAYADHLSDVQTQMTQASQGQTDPYLAGYERWYREFSSNTLDKGQSPLLSLITASRENAKYIEPVRAWYREHFETLSASPCGELTALFLSFAYDGLFFHKLFGLNELTPEKREALLAFMHELAQEPKK